MQKIQSINELEQEYFRMLQVVSNSKKTVSTYKSGINHFRAFLKLKFGFDEMILLSKITNNELDIYKVLRDFNYYLVFEKKLKPKGVITYLSGVKGYLRILGIRINSDDFKDQVRLPRIIKTRENPITKDMIVQLLRNSPQKLQTVILVICASGIRLGELVRLKLSDIDFSTTPTKIIIRGNATKGRMTRETFLTTEASNALKDYLRRYFDWNEDQKNSHLQDTYIFWRISKSKNGKTPIYDAENAKFNLQITLTRLIEKLPELNIKNENGWKTIHFHGFRKFFRTTIGNVCGRDYAEALMGHSFYMDTYYQLDDDKKRKMYLEAEPYLTISDTKTIEKNLKQINQKCNVLESKVDGLMNYLKTQSIEVPSDLC